MERLATISLDISQKRFGLRREHRSEMSLLALILDAVMDSGSQGLMVSAIARIANTSHYATMDKCQKLVDAGLLEPVVTRKNRIFRITTTGMEFLHECRRFQEIIEKINLQL